MTDVVTELLSSGASRAVRGPVKNRASQSACRAWQIVRARLTFNGCQRNNRATSILNNAHGVRALDARKYRVMRVK